MVVIFGARQQPRHERSPLCLLCLLRHRLSIVFCMSERKHNNNKGAQGRPSKRRKSTKNFTGGHQEGTPAPPALPTFQPMMQPLAPPPVPVYNPEVPSFEDTSTALQMTALLHGLVQMQQQQLQQQNLMQQMPQQVFLQTQPSQPFPVHTLPLQSMSPQFGDMAVQNISTPGITQLVPPQLQQQNQDWIVQQALLEQLKMQQNQQPPPPTPVAVPPPTTPTTPVTVQPTIPQKPKELVREGSQTSIPPAATKLNHRDILHQHQEELRMKQLKKSACQQASSRYAHYVSHDSSHFNFIIPALPLYLLDLKLENQTS